MPASLDKPFDPLVLRTFLAVAQHRNFTSAARELGLAQPTVSQHVSKLEAAAGRVLVVRDTRTVALTDNGEAMAGFARNILAAHDEASAYFNGSAMRGRLRFGAADELALTELPRILRDFRQLYPHINLELTVTQSRVLRRRLDAGHLDLIFINQEPDTAGGTPVRRDRLVWVGVPSLTFDAAAPVPIVVYHAPSYSRSAALKALEDAGLTWRIMCNTREINGVLAAARAGLGVCVLSQSRVPQDLAIMPRQLGLPELPEVDIALVGSPHGPSEPIQALTRAIMNVHIGK